MDKFLIYNHLPVFLQNILCSLYGYKLAKQRYNIEYDVFYKSLLQSDHYNTLNIIQFKEQKLFAILSYAYKHCKYYREKFDEFNVKPTDFKQISDISKFPILTKEDVRHHWKDMLSDEFDIKDLIPYHTSGSTGKALDFFWTKSSTQFYWATVWRGRSRFGIKKGDCHLNFTGKLVVPLGRKKPPYWRYNKSLNQYMLNMQHITKEKVLSIVDFINRTNFKFFVGYPSIIYSLANLIDELGLEITSPPLYIFSSAEKMYDYQQQLIEKVFRGTVIVEHYGFSEQAGCASKCKEGHYHEDFEMGHLELDPKSIVHGKNGDTGILLATGFQNFAMPFIRYEVGDSATFSKTSCICGLHSQVLVEIEGRSEDYIITPEGAHIMRMDYIFKDTQGIKECQVVQRKMGEIIIKIVKRDNYSLLTEQHLTNAVHELISPKMDVVFEYVNEIQRTGAGKFKAVVSELEKKQ